MRWNKVILKGLLYGLITGFLIGLFFKAIEEQGIANVYTLLLNVDFIPFIPHPLPQWQELLLHLIVSLIVGVGFSILMAWSRKPWIWGMGISLITIPLFIPLTLLSERTPQIDDTTALLWWIVGHLGYGVCLALLGLLFTPRHITRHFP
ncbi:hypothetical protein D3C73_768550 [compost metagenome]